MMSTERVSVSTTAIAILKEKVDLQQNSLRFKEADLLRFRS
jgi:hypothetical protein